MHWNKCKTWNQNGLVDLFFQRTYLRIFREKEKKKKRERNIHMEEKHWLVASHTSWPTGGLAHNPGMCPDQWTFPFQAYDQHTEPQEPVPGWLFIYLFVVGFLPFGLRGFSMPCFILLTLNDICNLLDFKAG